MTGLFFHRQSTGVIGALALVVAAALASNRLAATPNRPKKSDDMVKVQVAADPIDAAGNQQVSMTLTIEEGWHVYANPPSNENFTTVQTTVTAEPPLRPEAVQVAYPPGRKMEGGVLGSYLVYDGRVVIKATVQRTPGAAAQLNIKLQACCHIPEHEKCLLPAVVPVTLP